MLKPIRFEPRFPVFTKAVVEAIRQWRYAPAVVDGKAVPVCMRVSGNANGSREWSVRRWLRDGTCPDGSRRRVAPLRRLHPR